MKHWLQLAISFVLGALAFFLFTQISRPVSQNILGVTRTPSPTVTEKNAREENEFIVTKVIDGDTIELAGGKRVRYIGIDTPETVDPKRPVGCFGKEASAKNKRLVLGKTVRLEKDVSETDKYGRLLRYVYVGDVMINDYLVRQGFAHAVTYPPDVKLQELFRNAEQEAQDNNRGLWAGCPVSNPTNQINVSNPTNTTNPTNEKLQDSSGSDSSGACTIKGNISASGEKIYHMPGCGSYEKTVIDESVGERWFCSEDEAVKAGWRKAKNC